MYNNLLDGGRVQKQHKHGVAFRVSRLSRQVVRVMMEQVAPLSALARSVVGKRLAATEVYTLAPKTVKQNM